MKDPNSPNFSEDFADDANQDFSESFDDSSYQNLVAFMQQNKPIAPLAAPDFEQRLFAEISKYPQRSPQQIINQKLKGWLPILLVIPTTIVAITGFSWLNGRNQYQVASIQLSDAEKIAIEQSLINSWNLGTDSSLASLNVGLSAGDASAAKDTQILQDLSLLEYE